MAFKAIPAPVIESLVGAPATMTGPAIVSFGYPTSAVGRGKKRRKPLAEVASRERFGVPYSN